MAWQRKRAARNVGSPGLRDTTERYPNNRTEADHGGDAYGCNGCVTPTERGSPSRSGVVDDMGQRRRRVANRTVQERGRRSPITFRTDPLRSLADIEARTNYVDWLDN